MWSLRQSFYFWPRACEARPISYYVHYHYHYHYHQDYPFWKLVVISLNDDVIYEHDQSWFINWENFSLMIFFLWEIFSQWWKKDNLNHTFLIYWKLLQKLKIESIPFLRRGTFTIYELKDYLIIRHKQFLNWMTISY